MSRTYLVCLSIALLTCGLTSCLSCNRSSDSDPFLPESWPLEFMVPPIDAVFAPLGEDLNELTKLNGYYIEQHAVYGSSKKWVMAFKSDYEWCDMVDYFDALFRVKDYRRYNEVVNLSLSYIDEDNHCIASVYFAGDDSYFYIVQQFENRIMEKSRMPKPVPRKEHDNRSAK